MMKRLGLYFPKSVHGGRAGTRGARVTAGFALLLALSTAACDCGSGVDVSQATAEITATSPVVADGMRASLVTVRLLSDGEPLAGATLELVTDRGEDDELTQPESATDSDGVATGRVRSTVPGTSTVAVLAEGREIPGSATIVFVPEGECIPGEEEECYEGPEGTLGVGRCEAGVRTCNDEAEWGPCEGQVLPAEIDGVPCNGEDDNCDGTIDTHMDRSSPDSCGYCGNVCPDYPNAERLCDPDTAECSMGECDPGYYNLDGDPSTGCEYACDGDPEADEICDGTDTNCDGLIDGGPGGPFDVDGDGFSVCGTDFENGGTDPDLVDCDDLDPDVYPGAPGLCDGKDNNCDGEIDAPDEACDTGLACEIGRCEVDECVVEPLDCSALDGLCAVGVCDEGAGGCVVDAEQREGEPCETADGCAGTCAFGLCYGCECTSPAHCEDAGECGVALCEDERCVYQAGDDLCDAICAWGTCDPDTLTCVYDPEPFEGEICELNGCQGVCVDGRCDGCDCVSHEDCDDGVECTVDTCENHICVHEPDDSLCDDGDVCTGQATCDPVEGCVPGEPLVCDDGDECTVNLCDPLTGCYFPVRAPDPESPVISTAYCLTAGAGGRAVIMVDLRDEAWDPFEGATVELHVSGTPVSWIEPGVVESAAQPGVYYRTLEAPSSGAETTITAEATGCGQTVTLDTVVTLSYEDPVSGDRGETGGCAPRGGNLRVRVIDEDGGPIAGAFVMIGGEESSEAFHGDIEPYLAGDPGDEVNTAETCSDGYAVFFDAGTALSTTDMTTAGADGRAYVSLVSVQSSDLVLELPVTSPPRNEVEITGDVSGLGYPGSDDEVGLALVSEVMDLGFLLSFDIGNLFEDDASATLEGSGVVGGYCDGTIEVPGNIHLPAQRVVDTWLGNCDIADGVDPWTLRPYQSIEATDLFALYGTADPIALSEADTMVEMLSLVEFKGVALRGDVPRSTGSSGQDLLLTEDLDESMWVSVVDGPAGDCYLMALSDLDGLDGLGRLMLQGIAMVPIEEDDDLVEVLLTSHPAAGVFAGKRDLALALSMDMDTGCFSIELDRVTTGHGTDRVFESMLAMPSASVSGRAMSWSDVVRPGVSPDEINLSRSELRRESPRGQYKTYNEVFWLVYGAAGADGFTLPELPSWAPRAATGGFLVADPGEDEVNRWSLSLIHLGLLADPAEFTLDRHVLGREIEWLTHVAGDVAELP